MFYGSSSASMSLPSKSRMKRRTFTQVLYRTLSHRDRRSVTELPMPDDPAELSTQTSAPGVLKIFGDGVSAGANYKSVLATPASSAQELVKEALERYALSKASAHAYVLCDVIGRFEGAERRWRTECLRPLGNNEKPLLLQDLWKPKEGFARRFELCLRAEVEEMTSRDRDTVTADINAQARKLQRNRAKGTMTLSRGSFCRSLSETSLNRLCGVGEEPKRYYSTLPGPIRARCTRDGTSAREAVGSGRRKEERDGGGVRHSLYQSPHLLLLQGYNRQDCLVYLLNRDQHTVGQETASARPNICLASPDILPLHCRIRQTPSHRRGNEFLQVEPVAHGVVMVNFSRVDKPTPLRHGDLLSFGSYYIFLYKDPLGAGPLPVQTLSRLRALGTEVSGISEDGGVCRLCGCVLKERIVRHAVPKKAQTRPQTRTPSFQRRKLQLDFEKAHEDALVNRIVALIEPSGDDHKLTPAFLLCLCIRHSAMAFSPGSYAKLLRKISRKIQTIVWEKTKELAQKQAQHQDPASLSLLSISDLVPDLQIIFFWMSNAIEILYFIQQKSPTYMQRIEHLDKGSKESLLSATISVNEEAMTILEEVIMYTFQQCVYYITKTLYVVLPGLLDCNPFGAECTVSTIPEPVRKALSVFQSTQELLQTYLVHPEVQNQMFSYLFFFSNVSLFNQLMDKGPGRGWFQRSRVLQIQTCLWMLLDWTKEAGLNHLAQKFFTKFCSAVAILSTPPQQLVHLSWKALSLEHPSLKPVQLHRILSQYQLFSEITSVPIWQPTSEDEAYIYRTVDLLESFENHPPIVLPSGGFCVDVDSECVVDSVYRQLLYIRHFLWGLRTKPTSNGTADGQRELVIHSSPHLQAPPSLRGEGEGEVQGRGEEGENRERGRAGKGEVRQRGREGEGEERLREKVQRNGGPGRHPSQPLDSSCLLTPPNTPLYPDAAPMQHAVLYPETNTHNPSPHPQHYCPPGHQSNGCPPDHKSNGFISNGVEVELDKGPYGLGMGLIDGLHTELKAPGIYIRTLIPDGPAASDGRLHIGDRILAVNGTSLIGADYQSAVDLIRLGGGRLSFLVAKSDVEVSTKISASTC
ncbi:ras-associating and dilute domain-containing protein isoform X2 [Denticeps clupeoides]|uniref:Ras-associating and dilute domain-containing protein n=1 Tax=Denticeps clupeoides TaxID=299321 RepID=A0AAY4B0U4_9TELE|nr:ras-associating and dilute domain-containing protein isoform X2 [Denticeps clupeoides]